MSQLATEVLSDLSGKPPPGPNNIIKVTNPNAPEKPPLHALIIGIDDYSDRPLYGAVADAKNFSNYLISKLQVPESQITLLINWQAKRQVILNELKKLATSDYIQRDDPIVIFYSGHGSEAPAPADRAINGMVQCIVPHDSNIESQVTSIPDYVLGRLINDIADAKGDNITVIFDSCHSASATRSGYGSRYMRPNLLPPLPTNLDVDIVMKPKPNNGSRDLVDPTSLRISYPSMRSHVLLAACGHGQCSWEKDGQGVFTKALLCLLEKRNIDSMTYKWCIENMPKLETETTQSPVCEGANMDRIFFNSKVPGADFSFISIETQGQTSYLQAGLAHGIAPGSKFEIRNYDVFGPENPPVGKVEVDKVEAFRSSLKGAEALKLRPRAYGRQIAYGKGQVLKVFVTPEFRNAVVQSEGWLQRFTGNPGSLTIQIVTKDESDLIISYEGFDGKGQTTFTMTNPIAKKYGLAKLPAVGVAPVVEQVCQVLTGLGRWIWHLNQAPAHRPFQKTVKVEFFELRQVEATRDFEPIGDNLNVGGHIDIVVGSDEESYPAYGVNITNASDSIEAHFTRILPSSTREMDPTLPRGIPLTLGYGSWGEKPLAYLIKSGDVDVNFLKLYVTTEPTDFTSVAQPSPWPFGAKDDVPLQIIAKRWGNQPKWDVFTMTVVQWRTEVQNPFVQILQPTLPESGPAILPVECTTRTELRATSAKEKANDEWFRTPGFTQAMIDSKPRMRLRTQSNAEYRGKCPTNGKGWFMIAIMLADDNSKIDPDSGDEIVYLSHSSPKVGQAEWTNGVVFEPDHLIWKNISPDDYLQIQVKVRGAGWVIVAEEGYLAFW
ncbi:unnamed protein product [Rhizoctonia solani]|uniref:Peptidase C14 caspase domain-containing protein n=1 Tax=Rhizoctonia solani TaxID=456999 RepID=A0A8H2ZUK8_9AGAM|nr:unnamed protein product [Rhizoctonia solani]